MPRGHVPPRIPCRMGTIRTFPQAMQPPGHACFGPNAPSVAARRTLRHNTHMINQAVIPVAGLGTRMGPICRAVPKAMLPLPPGPSGFVLPAVHHILADASAGGIQRVALVVSPWQREVIDRYIAAARAEQQACDLPKQIELIDQPAPLGFGDAVLPTREFLGDRPFLVLLGDHVLLPAPGQPSCCGQLISAAEQLDRWQAVVGVQVVGEAELPKVGTCRGERISAQLYRCTDFVEKPDLATARRRLRTPGLVEGEYLAHFGVYAFTSELLTCLEELAGSQPSGELELADAQSMLLQRSGGDYYLAEIAGEALDVGSPAGYRRAFETLPMHGRGAQ
ncbi:MAG: sugar phosphate nucleotidyltransferase [Planctomycetota bacterium]